MYQLVEKITCIYKWIVILTFTAIFTITRERDYAPIITIMKIYYTNTYSISHNKNKKYINTIKIFEFKF